MRVLLLLAVLLLLEAAATSGYAPVCCSSMRPLRRSPHSDAKSSSFLRTSTVTLHARPSLYEQYEASRNEADARRLAAGIDAYSATGALHGYGAHAGWSTQEDAATPARARAPEPAPASDAELMAALVAENAEMSTSLVRLDAAATCLKVRCASLEDEVARLERELGAVRVTSWGATVRGTYGPAEASTCTSYAQ